MRKVETYTVQDYLALRTQVPDYQRDEGVWRRQHQELLLFTVLAGLAMPSLVLVHGDKNYHIADGLQRTNTLRSYIGEDFKLGNAFGEAAARYAEFTHDRTLLPLVGCTFTQLPPDMQARILNYEVVVETITPDAAAHRTALGRMMFELLQYGERISPGEALHAIPGKVRRMCMRLIDQPCMQFVRGSNVARYGNLTMLGVVAWLEHNGVLRPVGKKQVQELFTAQRDVGELETRMGKVIDILNTALIKHAKPIAMGYFVSLYWMVSDYLHHAPGKSKLLYEHLGDFLSWWGLADQFISPTDPALTWWSDKHTNGFRLSQGELDRRHEILTSMFNYYIKEWRPQMLALREGKAA